MLAIKQNSAYHLSFYSNEGSEPPHVHVKLAKSEAKYWLDPVRLDRFSGFRPHELGEIEVIVTSNVEKIREVWVAHFGPPQAG